MKKKPQKINRRTNLRHKLVEKKLLENLGKGEPVSVSKAMREVGYSEAYSKNPQMLKATRSWETILKEDFNDEFLKEQHMELFTAKEVQYFVYPLKMKDDDIIADVREAGFKVIVVRPSTMGKMAYYSIPNPTAKKAALDFAYKLKSKYAPEEFNVKFKGYTKEQLIDMILTKITKPKNV